MNIASSVAWSSDESSIRRDGKQLFDPRMCVCRREEEDQQEQPQSAAERLACEPHLI